MRYSDATLSVSQSEHLSGSSAYIAGCAKRLGRPWRHLHPSADDARELAAWLAAQRVRTLNVAGLRASSEAGIYGYVSHMLKRLGTATDMGLRRRAPRPALRK